MFDEENLSFFSSLADQLASVLYTFRLLDESRTHTIQLETAAEIARDISGSLNLDELLVKAVNYIRERFDFYHAAIFLLDTCHSAGVSGKKVVAFGQSTQGGRDLKPGVSGERKLDQVEVKNDISQSATS